MKPDSISVVVPGRPPTPNSRPNNWQESRRVSDEWRDTAHLAANAARLDWERAQRRKWVALKMADISVYIVVPDVRRRDFDNGVCSLKPLTDGIVNAGLLEDDSTQVIREFVVRYLHLPRRDEVRYTISEV